MEEDAKLSVLKRLSLGKVFRRRLIVGYVYPTLLGSLRRESERNE